MRPTRLEREEPAIAMTRKAKQVFATDDKWGIRGLPFRFRV
jgi:hypothetical protein